MRKVWISIALATAGLVTWYATRELEGSGATAWRTAKVERGDLVVEVTATGTLQPVTQVQVGTQVSGTIASLTADFNSRVKQGQIVAQLDPASYKARVESDRANVARSEADVLRVAALLKQAERDVARQEALIKDGLVTEQEYDAAVANRDSLLAQGKVSDASVAQMKAALTLSEVNLQYCTIASPVDGVVVSRNVDVGQTVAASLSAPTLFVIAADLQKMQVQAAVAEADIGRVVSGQVVAFDVDAYPGEKFAGTVSQVRIAPTTVQNVVTYTVIVDAPNPQGRLLPGMTANLSFEIERHNDVLMVADSALRFTPPEPDSKADGKTGGASASQGKPAGASGMGGMGGMGGTGGMSGTANGAASGGAGSRAGGGRDRKGEGSHGKTKEPDGAGRVWIAADGEPKPVDVKIGTSDGQHTVLLGTELAEGTEVIVGVQASGTAAPAATNPFQPQMGGGRGGGGGRPRF